MTTPTETAKVSEVWRREIAPHVETGRLRSRGWEDEQPQQYVRAVLAKDVIDALAARLRECELARDAYFIEMEANQARIDELMLEYCPDEMSEEQRRNWAKHQRAASPEERSALSAASRPPQAAEEPAHE